jgi:hypothetical protein
MTTITTTRRRWTDETIESELRALCAELGHFPRRAELVARGLRGLWDAMRHSRGVEGWTDRIAAGRPAASAEHIAARAYELYERGTPGDAMAHWLEAEQQLGW